MASRVIVEIKDLLKTYTEGGRTRNVLDSVNAEIYEGEFFVMLGKSGSGKSTLLNMLSGIDTPESGSVLIDGTDITHLNDTKQTLFRRDNIGIIFQFFNLIPTLTVLENAFPDKLSGGEQQRIAIARALVHEPKIVLADEPTGNLDEDTGETVLQMLLDLTRGAGKTLIMATHNPEIVPLADRVCRIHDGKLHITRNRDNLSEDGYGEKSDKIVKSV